MNFVLGIHNQTEAGKKLTNLEKKAMKIAERHVRWPLPHLNTPEKREEFFLSMSKIIILKPELAGSPTGEKEWSVPFIQRQRFFELLHFYWLSYSRGLLPLPPL